MFTTNEIHRMMLHHYDYVSNVINKNHSVKERIRILQGSGYNVQDCYVKDYNGVGGVTILRKKQEVRIIIGRPKAHWYREVFAVVIPFRLNGECRKPRWTDDYDEYVASCNK